MDYTRQILKRRIRNELKYVIKTLIIKANSGNDPGGICVR